MICQTRWLNSGALSVLQVHCFLISLWEYFTTFAYLLFPYGSHEASERDGESQRRAGFRAPMPDVALTTRELTADY